MLKGTTERKKQYFILEYSYNMQSSQTKHASTEMTLYPTSVLPDPETPRSNEGKGA